MSDEFGPSFITLTDDNGVSENVELSECAFVKLYDDGDLF